jgi:hypothetical protein
MTCSSEPSVNFQRTTWCYIPEYQGTVVMKNCVILLHHVYRHNTSLAECLCEQKLVSICLWMFPLQHICCGSRVGIVTGYGPDNLRVRVQVPVGSRIFTPPYRSEWLWGPPNLLSIGYWELFRQEKKQQQSEADRSLQLVLRSRKRGYIHPLPHMPSWCSA